MVKAFVNPATGRYAWVGLDECKVSFLNDFSWSTEIIDRSYFRAKQFTCHSQRTSMQLTCPYHTNPFFAPSKEPLEFIGKYNRMQKMQMQRMQKMLTLALAVLANLCQ